MTDIFKELPYKAWIERYSNEKGKPIFIHFISKTIQLIHFVEANL